MEGKENRERKSTKANIETERARFFSTTYSEGGHFVRMYLTLTAPGVFLFVSTLGPATLEPGNVGAKAMGGSGGSALFEGDLD